VRDVGDLLRSIGQVSFTVYPNSCLLKEPNPSQA